MASKTQTDSNPLRKDCSPESGANVEPAYPGGPLVKRSRSSPRRAGVLIALHVAFVVHLTHWYLKGRTLSPLEPSESMATLELGEVNCGFILFCAAILSTFVFGRVFCGWGCHLVALQDLCAWMMKKIGIRPRLFRSRILVWVPLVVGLYMFVWPTFKRLVLFPLWPGLVAWFKPVEPLHGFENALMTEGFWDTFAPWPIAIPFFLVCGFGIVYFMGAKGFCTYGCPYGGIFGLVDKASTGKIVADLDACEGCGHCTATCTSNVRVHEEIQAHEMVVNPGCMKCMDCVSVCPKHALSFKLARPTLFKKTIKAPRKPVYDLSGREELAFALVAVIAFAGLRGIYGVVPMLMALGLAGCLTVLSWKLWRMLRQADVRLYSMALKRSGQLRPQGVVFAGIVVPLLALTLHSLWVNYSHWNGNRRYFSLVAAGVSDRNLGQVIEPARVAQARAGAEHYRRARSIGQGGAGIFPNLEVDRRLAWLDLLSGQNDEAVAVYRDLVAAGRATPRDLLHLAIALGASGQLGEAEAWLRRILEELTVSEHATRRTLEDTCDRLATLCFAQGRPRDALGAFLARLARDPQDEHLRARAARIATEIESFDEAIRLLEAGLELRESAVLRVESGLARMARLRIDPALQALLADLEGAADPVLARRARRALWDHLARAGEPAMRDFERALELEPGRVEAERNLALLLDQMGRFPEAIERFRAVVERSPEDVETRVLLALTHAKLGQLPEAREVVESAIERAPRRADLYMLLGDVLEAAGEEAAAEAARQRARELQAKPK